MAHKAEDKAYISNKVDEILKPLLIKMFVANPSDPVSVLSSHDLFFSLKHHGMSGTSFDHPNRFVD